METFLVTTAIYVLSVFITRFINIKLKNHFTIIPAGWFIPLVNILLTTIMIFYAVYDKVLSNIDIDNRFNRFIKWFFHIK